MVFYQMPDWLYLLQRLKRRRGWCPAAMLKALAWPFRALPTVFVNSSKERELRVLRFTFLSSEMKEPARP
jgi:hypothetical protein